MAIPVTIATVAGIPIPPGATSVDISASPNPPWGVAGSVPISTAGPISVSYSVNSGGSRSAGPSMGHAFFFSLDGIDIPANGIYQLYVYVFGGADLGLGQITVIQNGMGGPLPPPPPGATPVPAPPPVI